MPEKLRGLLKEKFAFLTSLIEQKESAEKDAVKALFKTSDGFLIEAVLMKHDRNRRTVACLRKSAAPCSALLRHRQNGVARNLEAGRLLIKFYISLVC